MGILFKILILTVVYDVFGFIYYIISILYDITQYNNIVVGIMFNIITASMPTIYCFAMFMMQPHNDEEYKRFLRILYKCRIYHICFGCKWYILDQLEIEDEDEQQLEVIVQKEDQHDQYDTTNISTRYQGVNVDLNISELTQTYDASVKL